VTAPLSIRLRVPDTNLWIVVTPTDTLRWNIEVMDHASELPEDEGAPLAAREWLNRALSDLRHQLWEEIQRMRGSGR